MIGKWFAQLRVVHKLMLMSIFFLLPDSMMLCMVISDSNENIQFASQETKGNQYLRPLMHLMHLLPEHQRLARAVRAGDTLAIAPLSRSSGQIDQDLDALDAVDAKLGSDLQFTDDALAKRDRVQARPSYLRTDWKVLRDKPEALDPQVAADTYKHMGINLRLMVTHAGDMSNLILDPDLDSYYLMDATLLSIPQTQDELTKTIDDGSAALASGDTGERAAALSEIHVALLKADLDHVSNSVKTSVREDPDFYGVSPGLQTEVPPLLENYVRDVTAFIQLTEKLGTAGTKAPITAADYQAAGDRARTSGIDLWDSGSRQLDTLLQMRMDHFRQRRWNSLAITTLAILSASLLVTFINRSINLPLVRQARALWDLNKQLKSEVVQREQAQAALLDASRKAGMAEVATGVLHNVGNVLNSVNTSATVIREKLDKSKVPTLSKAAAMIQEHRADVGSFISEDPKGKQLPDLLTKLAEVMSADRDNIAAELTQLSRSVDHIKHIVQAQQSFAKDGMPLEEVDLSDLIEDALRINELGSGNGRIEVVREIGPCGPAMIDRHKVMQILVNLVSNAKRALNEPDLPVKRITVSLSAVDGRARICVADTGVGIPAENLNRIFRHGFTTRKDGHGFGLHAAANDAHAMGGSVTVDSAGTGKGAAFTLELPLSPDGAAVGTPAEVVAS